jgi:hypothetical protein
MTRSRRNTPGHAHLVAFGNARRLQQVKRERRRLLGVAAVLDLPKIGGAIAIAALPQALPDADHTVRPLAWDGRIEGVGLLPLLRGPEGASELSTHVELLRVLLGSDLAAFGPDGCG